MKKSSRLYVKRCISCLRGMSQIYFRNIFFLLKKGTYSISTWLTNPKSHYSLLALNNKMLNQKAVKKRYLIF